MIWNRQVKLSSIILFLLLLIAICQPVFAQGRSVDLIYAATTIIEGLKDEESKVIATGFFFFDSQKKIYLVTNKHVIYGDKYYENPEPSINKIKLVLHTNSQNLTQNEEVKIELFEGKNKKWIEHKDKDVDVVLIPVNLDQAKYVIFPIDKSFIEASDIEVGFEKIFVMGYPYGWYDKISNLPIVRVGHLSSPFKIAFQGKPVMLGDVETHKGMSGGPVFMKLENYIINKGGQRTTQLGASRIVLIGIHSGQPRWDLIDKRTGTMTQSDIRHTLIHIWFSDLILEILHDQP